MNAMRTGRIDLAVAPEHRRVAGFEYEPLHDEHNSLYCGRDSPLFPLPDRDITMR